MPKKRRRFAGTPSEHEGSFARSAHEFDNHIAKARAALDAGRCADATEELAAVMHRRGLMHAHGHGVSTEASHEAVPRISAAYDQSRALLQRYTRACVRKPGTLERIKSALRRK